MADQSTPGTRRNIPIHRRRYLRVVWFVVRTFVSLLLWDVLLRRTRWAAIARRSADRRWKRHAEQFRELALRLGGVQIKLGQFLSSRVDVMPTVVTQELADLQDEVPPEDFDEIQDVIREAFGRSIGDVFDFIDPEPLGAASLAQAHRAALAGGDDVVVKVQRPRIESLVETDLAALRVAVALLRRWRFARERVDLDELYDEFARITRSELDFEAEGRNAERFAECFADDPRIHAPTIYWEATRRRVLTMEDVSGIKVTNLDGLRAAGIDPAKVADAVVECFLEQAFVHNFIHADPHPGNLFVQPLTSAAEGQTDAEGNPVLSSAASRDGSPSGPVRFRICFVDFGMMAVVPERVRSHLRDYLVAFATRDAALMVSAYDGAGLLLPDADRQRIIEAQSVIFDRFWGVSMGDIQRVAFQEAGTLVRDFEDLVREMPFQMPADLLFVGRGVAIISGLATQLDPEFDVWAAVRPFATRLVDGDGSPTPAFRWLSRDELLGQLQAAVMMLRPLVTLPGTVDRLAGSAASGNLRVQNAFAPDMARAVGRLDRIGRRMLWAVMSGAVGIAGAILRAADPADPLSTTLLGIAGAGLLFTVLRR